MKTKLNLLFLLATITSLANTPVTITVINESGPNDAPVAYWNLYSYAVTQSAGVTPQDESYDINTSSAQDWFNPGTSGTINSETVANGQYLSGSLITGIHCVLQVQWNSGPPSYQYHTKQFDVNPDFPAGGGAPTTATVLITTGTNSLNCTTNLTWNVKNQNPDWRIFAIINTGTGSPTYDNPQQVAPGSFYTYTETGVPCTNASNYQLGVSPSGADDNIQPTGIGPNANSSAGSPPPTNSPSGGSMPTNQPSINPETNSYTAPTGNTGLPQSNILWSSASQGATTPNGTAIASSIQNGDSVLHNDIVSAANQAHQDANKIANDIKNLSVTNGTILNLTNYNLETTQKGISNLLSNLGTNGGMTLTQFEGTANTVQSDLSSNGYNFNSTNGASQLSLNNLSSGFGTPSVDESGDVGDVSMLDINLGNNTGIQLLLGTVQIDEIMPALHDGLPIFRWTVILLLIICNYKILVKAVKTTMLVPQATTSGETVLGTNVNAASALIMAGAIVAVVASLPTVFASGVLDNIAKISIGNPISGGGSGIGKAYGFACHYFPVGTMITALLNHLGFRALLDSAESVCMGIIKFLTGL